MKWAFQVCCKTMQHGLEKEKIVLQSVYGKAAAFASGDHGYNLLFPLSFCPFCGTSIEPTKKLGEIRNGEGVIATVEIAD